MVVILRNSPNFCQILAFQSVDSIGKWHDHGDLKRKLKNAILCNSIAIDATWP